MIFKLSRKEDKELESMYNQAMNELESFYKLGWNRNKPKIIIVRDRIEINDLRNEKTPRWIVGWAEGQCIYLLDRNNYEKESSHKYSIDTYYKLLKHELSHLFFSIISRANSERQFIWFNEGVAGCLSEQYKDKPIPEKFENFLDQYSNWNGKAYQESAYAVKLLQDKFGGEKLLKLVKSLSRVAIKKDFNNSFKKLYGSLPTYSFFNKMLEKSR